MYWANWVVIALFCVVNYLLFLSFACRIENNTFEIIDKVDYISKKINEEKESPEKSGEENMGINFKS